MAEDDAETVTVQIYARSNNGPAKFGFPVKLTEAEWKRLSGDWLKHLELNKPQGGSYDCAEIAVGNNKPRAGQLLLRFADLTALEVV